MTYILKKGVKRAQIFHYHKEQKAQALKILKNIESINGKLEKKFLKISDEYAEDQLGWKGFAPWLYVYCAVSGSFKEGWIPDNYYGKIVIPALKGDYSTIGDRKALTNILFNTKLFPDQLYHINGLFLSPKSKIISKQEAKDLLLCSTTKIVFKTEGSLQGRGVQIINPQTFSSLDISTLENGVFQKYITQHPFFSEIVPNSVATIRMTTAISSEGIPSLRACYLRVGRTNDTHIKSSSHIRISIDMDTGKFSDFGYTTEWQAINKHPDTKYPFKGNQIPCFQECKEAVLDLHTKVPFTRIIGWDLVVNNKNEIQIMEWNSGHNDIKFSEATQGPIFRGFNFEDLWKRSSN